MPLPQKAAAIRRPVTASVVPLLMTDTMQEALMQHYSVAIGELDAIPVNWPMALGSWCEELIATWWSEHHPDKPIITEQQSVVAHPTLNYFSATLDGYIPAWDMVIDTKMTNPWKPVDEVISFYTPQVICQMECRRARRGGLLICHGTSEPRLYEIYRSSKEYEAEMWRRIAAYWLCIKTKTPPFPPSRVVPPEEYKTYDLDEPGFAPTNWSMALRQHATEWDATKDVADAHAIAVVNIKQVLPDNAGKVSCGAVRIVRNRAGSVSIKRRG